MPHFLVVPRTSPAFNEVIAQFILTFSCLSLVNILGERLPPTRVAWPAF